MEPRSLSHDEAVRLLDLSHDAIFSWSEADGIRSWNRGATLLYGFTEDEALGRVTHDLLQTTHPIPWQEIEDVLAAEGEWVGQVEHRTKSGRDVLVATRHQIVVIGDERIVLETNRDITAEEQRRANELTRINRELQQHSDQLEAANAALEQFTHMTAHDLRGPVRQLVNLADLALDEDEDELGEVLRMIRSSAGKLDELISSYGRVARLERGDDDEVTIDELVDDALSQLTAPPHVTIERTLSLAADRSLMTQLLMNLLGNAAKHGAKAVVSIDAHAFEDVVHIHVRNPVDPDLHVDATVFAPFRRLASDATGTGMGLAISRRIVELHDGSISASNDDGWFVVTVTLPGAAQ